MGNILGDGVVLYLNCDGGHRVYKLGKTQVNVDTFVYINYVTINFI